MVYAAPCFVELVVAASRDDRSQGAPIYVKQRGAAEYFRFHPLSAKYSYDYDGPIPLPPTWNGNINGNVGARQTGGAPEARLIESVPGRSPKAWRVVDERAALERFPTTMPMPDSITIRVERGVAVVDRPSVGRVLDSAPTTRPRRTGWTIRYGAFQDRPGRLATDGPAPDVDIDDFSVYVATTEHLLRRTEEHEALVDAARELLSQLDPETGLAGDLLPDLAWDCASGRVVAEVKTLGETSEDTQIRLGLGQVLQYRWQESVDRGTDSTIAVLIVSREPSGPWSDVCAAVGVRLMWPPLDFGDLGLQPTG